MSFPVEEETLTSIANVFTACPLDGEMLPELRETLARRLEDLDLADLQLHPRSLTQDPVHHTRYYLAADRYRSGESIGGDGILLAFFAGAHPQPPSFPIQDAPASFDIEASPWTVWAIPFSSTDDRNISWFAGTIAREFLPRTSRRLPAMSCEASDPEIRIPAMFQACEGIYQRTGVQVTPIIRLSATQEMGTEASLATRVGEHPTAPGHSGESIRDLWQTAIWSAIRAGFRAGYALEADGLRISGDSETEIEASFISVTRAIVEAAAYTKFNANASDTFDEQADRGHPETYNDIELEQLFLQRFSPADQAWIFEQFEEPFRIDERELRLAPEQIRRLAVKFGRGLQLCEALYDKILAAKAAAEVPTEFDFEVCLRLEGGLTTPEDLLFCLNWLKAGGRQATHVVPSLGISRHHGESGFEGTAPEAFREHVRALAATARYFGATLSIHAGNEKQPGFLSMIERETQGSVNFKVESEEFAEILWT